MVVRLEYSAIISVSGGREDSHYLRNGKDMSAYCALLPGTETRGRRLEFDWLKMCRLN